MHQFQLTAAHKGQTKAPAVIFTVIQLHCGRSLTLYKTPPPPYYLYVVHLTETLLFHSTTTAKLSANLSHSAVSIHDFRFLKMSGKY